jgi:hypothetical protein
MNQQCGNCKWWDRDNIIGTTSKAGKATHYQELPKNPKEI